MAKQFTNIHHSTWEVRTSPRGERWKFLDLSGKHLGVRLEELLPGETSSIHHYHSLEEEHVIVLEGAATLILGSEELALRRGDHVWFAAGEEVPHHIENKTTESMKMLVFGERNEGDVVFYPTNRLMMVKATGWKQFTYEERAKPK
jgi:uncharacterized cupin superfamily protein